MDLSLEDVKELTDSNKIQEIFLKLREQEVLSLSSSPFKFIS